MKSKGSDSGDAPRQRPDNTHATPGVVRTSAPLGGSDPARLADRLSGLVHDLSSLLDGSLRQVSLISHTVAGARHEYKGLVETEHRLRTLRAALEQMARSVTGAMQSGDGRPWREGGTMCDAVHYAAAIMEPLATEHGVRLSVEVDEALKRYTPGPVYTVVLNGVRNAVEAIATLKRGSGRVRISAIAMNTPGSPRAMIEIIDDGPGLPTRSNARALIEPGVTTKPGHLGIGLSLTHELVENAGGIMELRQRDGTRGAALIAQVPAEMMNEQAGDCRRDAEAA